MAEIIVSAVINVLVEKLISGDLMHLARSEGIDSKLKKWKKTLPLIQAVLVDAGQKQIRDRAVELWVHELHDLAYDIDDLLDDLATEAMRRKLNQDSYASTSTSTGKVLKMIPTSCTNFTPRNIKYGRKMSSKLDVITAKLLDLVEHKNNLGLDVNVVRSNRMNRRLEQTSLIDESKIVGREGDKEALLGRLLGNEASNQNVSIVSIVGMGGVGKTTLAKVLYNEEKVKDHFELRAWVSVSQEFDVSNISKSIFQAVAGVDKNFANLDLLHVALKEKLSKKRFLLVLDDVWNEDYREWELLQSPFLVGAHGSTVIVTTRKTTVASMMGSVETYNLEVLSNEKALSLFAQYALGEHDFDNHPTLKLHARGIVKKCGRLPLALITLGRVLKIKRNEDEWEELLNSELWNLQGEREILPALRLSYYDLPPHMKQMFAYCSLFPKGYQFDKDELVLLWMAEGFLSKSNGNKSMESLGRECFEELKSRSFFQHSKNKSQYTMHDLINDLAISVAEEFFFMFNDKMDASPRNEAFEKLRHFSFIGRRSAVYRKFKELQRASCLRTFLPVSVQKKRLGTYISLSNNDLVELLPRLQFLRVLSLAHCSITEVPQSIGDLKHMRYLNLSHTKIRCLPEQVSALYNLQSLLVSGCHELCSLAVSFAKLKNLRHLDTRYTLKLNNMPLGIGGLTSLQTLTKAIIEGANGFNIAELKDLLDLQGQLSIEGLHKVTNAGQAKDANLHQKKGLDGLVLEWSRFFDDSRNETTETEVLEGLRPHEKLRNLEIGFYGGMRFPSWVGSPSFDQLTKLTLRGCTRCTRLPTLGHLRSLRNLVVSGMDKVKTVGPEFLAPAKSFHDIAFPSLEFLMFDGMKSWEIWSTSGGTATSFPCLGKIYIKGCPKLAQVSIGSIPLLRDLDIGGCSEVVLRSLVGACWTILKLTISGIQGLIKLDGEVLKHLGVVEELLIYKCDELRYLWESESEACNILVSLRELEVGSCSNLVSLGEKVEVNLGISMESIRQVSFHSCGELESYNCPYSVEKLVIQDCCWMTSLTFSTVSISSLKNLWIMSCGNLISCHGGCLLHLTDLTITECDSVESIPETVFDFGSMSCLRVVYISLCKNLKSFPHEHLQSVTSLEKLSVMYCPSMDYSFPCGMWPPNLTTLEIRCLNKPMSEWGHQNYPTSLVSLTLDGKVSGVVSFAVEKKDARNGSNRTTSSSSFLLPSSLTSLSISFFLDVESLSEVLQGLTCLEELRIWACPKLKDHLPDCSQRQLRIHHL